MKVCFCDIYLVRYDFELICQLLAIYDHILALYSCYRHKWNNSESYVIELGHILEFLKSATIRNYNFLLDGSIMVVFLAVITCDMRCWRQSASVVKTHARCALNMVVVLLRRSQGVPTIKLSNWRREINSAESISMSLSVSIFVPRPHFIAILHQFLSFFIVSNVHMRRRNTRGNNFARKTCAVVVMSSLSHSCTSAGIYLTPWTQRTASHKALSLCQ